MKLPRIYHFPKSVQITYKHTTSECMAVQDFYSLVSPKRVGSRPVVSSHPKAGIIRLSDRAGVFQDRFR